MDSFGLWYQSRAESSNLKVDFHVNLWDFTKKKDEGNFFVDFGIKISGFKSIDKIKFLIPFKIEDKEIIDLSRVLKEDEVQIIFNDSECLYKQYKGIYNGMVKGEENVIFLPIKENNVFLKNISLKNDNVHYLTIDFSGYKDLPEETTAVYFRFRIKSANLRTEMLCTLKEKNRYLESAFQQREVMDFKINNVRNISKFIIKNCADENFQLIKLNAIHIFLMVPSSYEVTIWDNFSECRKLEEDSWKNYLLGNVDFLKEHKSVSAYHWKKKASPNSEDSIEEFSQLIRIEHKATNSKMLTAYCFVVVGLGALGSLIASGIIELLKLI